MSDFRIMPAQGKIEKSGTRYGFVIPNHPLGIKAPTPMSDFRVGDFIATWETRRIAEMAAHVLGIPMDKVAPVAVLTPSDGGWS